MAVLGRSLTQGQGEIFHSWHGRTLCHGWSHLSIQLRPRNSPSSNHHPIDNAIFGCQPDANPSSHRHPKPENCKNQLCHRQARHTYMESDIDNGWVQVEGSNWAFDADEQVDESDGPWNTLDIDQNGTTEVILTGGIFVGRHIAPESYGHQRKTKMILMWNGKNFVIHDTEYGPAEFRFQAVQDADYAALKGQYDKALSLYQQAISSDTLDWWSPSRRENNIARADVASQPVPTPTLPVPDLTERGYLTAYAYYRIMVTHTLQGDLTQAQNALQTLQKEFPVGKPESVYTELAAAFWNAYQASQKIELACQAAIAYAEKNPKAVLHYIGEREYHPYPSLDYQPADICPFKVPARNP